MRDIICNAFFCVSARDADCLTLLEKESGQRKRTRVPWGNWAGRHKFWEMSPPTRSHLSSLLENERQTGLKSTQVIFLHRGSDYVSPATCFSVVFQTFIYSPQQKENPTYLKRTVEWHCLVSDQADQPETDQDRCGACRWSSSFGSCLVVTGPALNGSSQWRNSDRPKPPPLTPCCCVCVCVDIKGSICILLSLIETWQLSGTWNGTFPYCSSWLWPCDVNDSCSYVQ